MRAVGRNRLAWRSTSTRSFLASKFESKCKVWVNLAALCSIVLMQRSLVSTSRIVQVDVEDKAYESYSKFMESWKSCQALFDTTPFTFVTL